MAIKKSFQVQPEKKLMRLLKSAGLVLFVVAFVLLPETAVNEAASVSEVFSMDTAEDRIVEASLENNALTQIPAKLDAAEVEMPETEELPEIQPIDYQIACFESDDPYTYNLLIGDIEETLKNYNGLVSYDIIGQSVQGKDIYALTVGSGPVHVLITAGVHARENANTPLIMQCLFDFLYAAANGDDAKAQILNRVTLIIVPLVNPDGYQSCLDSGSGKKKTNGNNVDINRNFPCKYWGSRVKKPGNYYPGPFPGSEPETQAIMALFDRYDFALAVDIHSRAREIICEKGGYTAEDISTHEDPQMLNDISLSIARYLLEDIKYDLVKELKVKKGEEGTLTDYAFSRGVPTVTFETLKYKKNRLASPAEIQKEYVFFDWTTALYKIAESAADLAE